MLGRKLSITDSEIAQRSKLSTDEKGREELAVSTV